MKLFRKEEGFTLVELMVVVLIIGILIAIAIPVFNAAKSNAQKKSCFANQRTIEGSFQNWLADDNTGVAQTVALPDLVPNYIKVAPKCPTSGNGYTTDASGTVAADASHGHF